MNKKLYFNIVFYIVGSFILITLGIIVAMNFSSDAKIFERSVAKTNKDKSIQTQAKPTSTAKVEEKNLKDTAPVEKTKTSGAKTEDTAKAQKIKVEVINYTGIKKLTEDIRTTLEADGFDVSTGNDSSNKLVTTEIIDRNDKKAGIEIQKVLKIGRLTKEYDAGSRYDVTVVLGDDYKP
jgi:hypothetical protein